MEQKTFFERAIFFSWFCSLGDCKFCYMSLQKKTRSAKDAKRSFSSIIAEALLCRELGWKVEFLSGGYESYSKDELLYLIKTIASIMKEKQWLNIGTLTKKELELFKPYIKGYAGTIETVNWSLRKKVCPSKSLTPIIATFKHCDSLRLNKAITIIIGIGETIDDYSRLERFIKKYSITRITFYALNPHPGTCFTNSPEKKYYCEWIKRTRKSFPDIYIIAGAWIDKPDYYSAALKAGANSITKLPALRKFNSKELKKIEKEIKKAKRILNGTLTILPKIDWNKKVDKLTPSLFDQDLKEEIKKKLKLYLSQMKLNQD
jgi:biotin synthase-like enzyme